MVAAFLKPPSHLFKPAVAGQVLAHLLAQKWSAMSMVMRLVALAASMLMSLILLKGIHVIKM